jgi:hypothetical protein
VIDQEPIAIQLRYLQTLTEIGAEKNTTVVFPLPIDLISGFITGAFGGNGRGGGGGDVRPAFPPEPESEAIAEQPEAPALGNAPVAPPIVEDEP